MKETTEKLHFLLQDFCAANGEGRFQLDDDGICSLILDDSLIFNISALERSKEILLFAPVGILPEKSRANLITEMLGYNFFPDEPGRFSFAVQDKDTVILNARRHIQNLDLTGFQNLFDRFLKILKQFQVALDVPTVTAADSLETPAVEPPSAPEPEAMPSMPTHMTFMIKG